MAKKAKKPASKVVSGSTKKSKRPMKLTRRAALFALVGILAFSIIAGMGWQKWQDHQFRARAAGWSTMYSRDGLQWLICKTYVNSAYGPLWKLTLVAANGSNKTFGANYRVMRNNTVVASLSFTAYPGQWVVKEVFASQIYRDYGSISSGFAGESPVTGVQYYDGVTTC